jgi:hypothetical protein
MSANSYRTHIGQWQSNLRQDEFGTYKDFHPVSIKGKIVFLKEKGLPI